MRRLMLRVAGWLLARLPMYQEARRPQRILIIKPDHLGDLLLLTPALGMLRETLPTAHITLLAGPWAASLLQGSPLVDLIQPCQFPGFTRQRSAGRLAGCWLLLQTAVLLRTAHYDAAIIARDDHWWGALLAALAGIRCRIGYATADAAPFLTKALPHDPHAHVTAQGLELVAALCGIPAEALAARMHHPARTALWVAPGRGVQSAPVQPLPAIGSGHDVTRPVRPAPEVAGQLSAESADELLDSATPIDAHGAAESAGELLNAGISAAAQPAVEPRPLSPAMLSLHMPRTAAADRWAAAQLPAGSQPIVAIQPGAGGAAKLWLPERWIAVGQALEANGWHVVVTGGPSEAALVTTVAAGLRRPQVITNAPTIQHLAALFARCTLVLGVDSGPLHIAVAVGVPSVALFGPSEVGRFGPWGDPNRHRVLGSTLWCAPCGVLDHCPRGTEPSECMTLIKPEHVLALVPTTPPA